MKIQAPILLVTLSLASGLSLGCEQKSSKPVAPKTESSARSAGEAAGRAAEEGSKAATEAAKQK